MNRSGVLLLCAMLGLTALSVIGFLHGPPDPEYVLPEFREGYTPLDVARSAGIAWVYIGSGLIADRRRPESRAGLLMIGVGGALLIEGLTYLPIPAVVTLAIWLSPTFGLADVLLGTLVLTYPSGRPGSRPVRLWIGAAGAYLLIRFGLTLVVPVVSSRCAPGCRPLFTLTYDEGVQWGVENWLSLGFALLSGFLVLLVIGRWLTATPASRRILLPVTVAGLLFGLVIPVNELLFWMEAPMYETTSAWRMTQPFLSDVAPAMAFMATLGRLTQVALPLALLWGLLRTRLGQAAVGELARQLTTDPAPTEPGRVREAVSRALGDPTLEIALWSRQSDSWIDGGGRPIVPAFDDEGRAVTRLDAADGPVAVLVHDPALNDRPELVAAVTAVAQLALENERLHAEVKAQLEEVRQSRERIVRATDDERRRVERNIHDGAQQRLVSLSLALGLARTQATQASPQLEATLAAADAELRGAISELRELARGIHPAILTEAGLGPALESLAEHAPFPVTVTADLNGRLSPVVEATAYFVAAEALTNAAKHAGASGAHLHAAVVDGALQVEISDDGRGGADPAAGTGLRGMLDRVTALGGHLSVGPGATGGTLVRAEIPCA